MSVLSLGFVGDEPILPYRKGRWYTRSCMKSAEVLENTDMLCPAVAISAGLADMRLPRSNVERFEAGQSTSGMPDHIPCVRHNKG